MSPKKLPIVPRPLPDELLSSWLERIALFYGGDYELAHGALFGRAGRFALDQTPDIDSDRELRRCMSRWTGVRLSRVPALLGVPAGDCLPTRARLSYCAACWDDDVASGNPPYVRRRWAHWSAVHCDRHMRWLDARRESQVHEFHGRGWSPLWKGRPQWASCFELQWESSFDSMLAGFDPSSLKIPNISWCDLSCDLLTFERAGVRDSTDSNGLSLHRAILNLVQTVPLDLTRGRVADMFSSSRMSPHHILYVRTLMPMELGARVVTLVIVVEILRLITEQGPLNVELSKIVSESQELGNAIKSLRSAAPKVVQIKKRASA